MTSSPAFNLPGTPVWVLCTDTTYGDQRSLISGALPPGPMARVGVPAWPLYRANQVHGATVLHVAGGSVHGGDPPSSSRARGGPGAGSDGAGPGAGSDSGGCAVVTGDALVGVGPGAVVGVLTADCVPLAIGSTAGVFSAVHVGWRGLLAGVVEAAVAAVMASAEEAGETGERELDDRALVAAMGPAIGPCCYAFAPGDALQIAERVGRQVLTVTRTGEPALDLPGAVQSAVERCGVVVAGPGRTCTACGGPYFSHRARGDQGRQVTAVWCAPIWGRRSGGRQ